MSKQKAYPVNCNTFYFNLDDFKDHYQFSLWMYEFLNFYVKEEYEACNSDYAILMLKLHNSCVYKSLTYLYPYTDLGIGFDVIFKKSIEDKTKFLILEIDFIDEAEHKVGSLI